jgi:hypothetical protein
MAMFCSESRRKQGTSAASHAYDEGSIPFTRSKFRSRKPTRTLVKPVLFARKSPLADRHLCCF